MPFRKTVNQIARINQQTKDEAQTGIPAGQIKNQLPPYTLPPGGPSGDGYPPDPHDHTSSTDGGVLTNDAHDGYSVYSEIAAPSTPAANTARLYAKDVAGVTEFFYKNSAGTERDLSAASGAPTDATYITQTANGGLSAEQALSSLATGYVKNTTGTGVLSVQAAPIPVADGGTGVTAIPSFSAYKNASQSVNNATFTKIAFQAEDFDSNGNYDNATDYRFTPTVAGAYLIISRVGWSPTLVDQKLLLSSIYKNGTRTIDGTTTTSGTSDHGVFVAGLVQMNGSTDYVEIYGYQETGG